MFVHHIYVSSGHNFFGHHGGPAGTSPTIEVSEVECVAGRGLRGDRFFDYETDYKGQVTLFSKDVFEEACAALGLPGEDPSIVRRNVIVSGVDLTALIGSDFEIQGIRFRGVEECKPCHWMDQAVAAGAKDFLAGRGGLRCRIVSGGVLRRDGVPVDR